MSEPSLDVREEIARIDHQKIRHRLDVFAGIIAAVGLGGLLLAAGCGR